jgi:hypothetical protein
MDPVTIALLAGTAIKGISSLVKGIRGRKEKKKGETRMEKAIADIKYSRPEEYERIMNILGQRPGRLKTQQEMVEGDIRRSTTAGTAGIRQLADSPVAALGAYSGLKEREQKAIADVGIQFEGMQDEAILGQAEGLKMGASFSEKEQYYNEIYKNMIKANLGASQMEAGRNMAWEGFEGFAGAGLDFIGTKYLSGKINPTEDLGSAGTTS